MTAAQGSKNTSIVRRDLLLMNRASLAPAAEPRKEPAAAMAAALTSIARPRQNCTTVRVVPQALENLLEPSAKWAGMPVKR